MASTSNPRNTLASTTTTTNAPPAKSAALVPTNSVTTKDGQTVRARIDPTLAVDDVIRQLCLNLKIQEPPVLYALRDDADELVTDDNLRKKIKGKVNLKYVQKFTMCDERKTYGELQIQRLVSAPIIEAAEIVEKLSLRDERTLRLTLFSLQKFIRVRRFDFNEEF